MVIDSDNNNFSPCRRPGLRWQFDKRSEPKYRIDSSRGDWTTHIAFDPGDPRAPSSSWKRKKTDD
jgi:hypothetical protein